MTAVSKTALPIGTLQGDIMRIFVTGCKGQLGRSLYAALAEHTLTGCDLPPGR